MHRVLVADPPWLFTDKLPGKTRGASKQYSCMELQDICNFPLPQMERDSILFLWRVSSMVEEAYQVVRAWGFVPHSEIVWRKTTKSGKRFFGMGRIVRGEHETCIIARRGKPLVQNLSTRSTFDAPVGRHSEKPEMFFQLVEKLYKGPYCEIFSRRQRLNWTCLGDQVK